MYRRGNINYITKDIDKIISMYIKIKNSLTISIKIAKLN